MGPSTETIKNIYDVIIIPVIGALYSSKIDWEKWKKKKISINCETGDNSLVCGVSINKVLQLLKGNKYTCTL